MLKKRAIAVSTAGGTLWDVSNIENSRITFGMEHDY